jgi:hypothetical protein
MIAKRLGERIAWLNAHRVLLSVHMQLYRHRAWSNASIGLHCLAGVTGKR